VGFHCLSDCKHFGFLSLADISMVTPYH
jgi:hypothetical protein